MKICLALLAVILYLSYFTTHIAKCSAMFINNDENVCRDYEQRTENMISSLYNRVADAFKKECQYVSSVSDTAPQTSDYCCKELPDDPNCPKRVPAGCDEVIMKRPYKSYVICETPRTKHSPGYLLPMNFLKPYNPLVPRSHNRPQTTKFIRDQKKFLPIACNLKSTEKLLEQRNCRILVHSDTPVYYRMRNIMNQRRSIRLAAGADRVEQKNRSDNEQRSSPQAQSCPRQDLAASKYEREQELKKNQPPAVQQVRD